MTHAILDILLLDPGEGVQTVRHPTFVLGHNGQIVLKLQIVVVVDGSPQGVFDGEAGIVAFLGCDGSIAGFEIGPCDGDDVGAEEFAEGFFGVGSGFALVADADGALGGEWSGGVVGGVGDVGVEGGGGSGVGLDVGGGLGLFEEGVVWEDEGGGSCSCESWL